MNSYRFSSGVIWLLGAGSLFLPITPQRAVAQAGSSVRFKVVDLTPLRFVPDLQPEVSLVHGTMSINNLGQVVGWAENGVHDPNCCCTQVLQFRPAVWDLGSGDQIHDLPLISGDTSGAATAINDNGQVVGISGICDQALGRHTARHAVLWENGGVTDIGNLGANWWNTPTAINQQGDVVGFAGDPAFVEGEILHAFIWTKDNGIKALKPLRGRVPEHVDSEAYGINEARQVVGVSCDADANCLAVIWDHGVYPTDLNDLKGGYSAILETAKDINDNGEITGRAITDPVTGAREAYLAVPVQ